jgi:signal transduction histidine kinase
LYLAIRERVKGATSRDRSSGKETTLSIMMRPLIYLGYYLALAAIAFRGLDTYFSDDHEGRWVAVGLLLAFFVLSVWCYWLARRVWWYPHLYMTLQGGLALGLLLLPPHLDYFSILYFLLSAQAMLLFPQRVGYLWLGILAAAMAGALLSTSGWREALPLILLYGAGFYFFGSFTSLTAQSEAARAELQEADSQLREYAAQAEELAVTQERNRLARDLHDSVTQSIFSMTLTAEAARILLERDHTKVAVQLERLQNLARDALTEMRSLIYQLHTADGATEELVPAIRKHLASLESREGLIVELHVEGEEQLPQEQREGLLRIVQEALSNVSKHAQTDRAVVALNMADGKATLSIEDRGVGFDSSHVVAREGHLGLASIRERAEIQGGKFKVESSLGEGTRIIIEVPYTLGA